MILALGRLEDQKFKVILTYTASLTSDSGSLYPGLGAVILKAGILGL